MAETGKFFRCLPHHRIKTVADTPLWKIFLNKTISVPLVRVPFCAWKRGCLIRSTKTRGFHRAPNTAWSFSNGGRARCRFWCVPKMRYGLCQATQITTYLLSLESWDSDLWRHMTFEFELFSLPHAIKSWTFAFFWSSSAAKWLIHTQRDWYTWKAASLHF